MKNFNQKNFLVNQKLSKESYSHLDVDERYDLALSIPLKQRYKKQYQSEAKSVEERKSNIFGKKIIKNNENFATDILEPTEENIAKHIPLFYAVAKNWQKELYKVLKIVQAMVKSVPFMREFSLCSKSESKIQKVMKYYDSGTFKGKHGIRVTMTVLRYYLKYINIECIDGKYAVKVSQPMKETIIANLLQRTIDAVNCHNKSLANKCGYNKWIDLNIRDTKDPRSAKIVSIIRCSIASYKGIKFSDIIESVQKLSLIHIVNSSGINCLSRELSFVLIFDKYFILINKNNNYYLFLFGTYNNNILYIFLKILQ